MKTLTGIASFFEQDLWQPDIDHLPWLRRLAYRHLRIFYIGVSGFIDHQCLLKASALTYMALLSLVPLLALTFSILKGLGAQRRLEPLLLERVSAGSEEVVSQIIRYIDKTNVNTLGALGLVGLIATAISMIGNIEHALNGVWGVKRTRSLNRKFSDYLSVLLTCPVLILAALALTSSIQSISLVQTILLIPGIGQLLLFLANFSPYFFLWIALTLVYIYLPNTTVRFSSALFGGVIAGTLLQVGQWGYVNFQIGMARYNAIYGAFAQLPIFLGWLYLGWATFLFGGLISFAHQNVRTYGKNLRLDGIPYSFREELALKLLVLIGRGFCSGANHWTSEGLAAKINVPLSLVNGLLRQYCEAGIVLTAEKGGQEVYVLSRPPERLGIDQALELLRNYGKDQIQMKAIEGDAALKGILNRIAESRRALLGRLTLKDLVENGLGLEPRSSSGSKPDTDGPVL